MIGLIIPPGEIKKLVETTAAWVAENGANFEEYIIEKSKNDSKFAFLNTTHPYRGYFDQMVEQNRAKLIEGTVQPKQELQFVEPVKKQEQPLSRMEQQQKTFIEKVFKQVKVPDPDQFFVQIPEKLNLLDIDIIQHTAQYVAKNGKKFLEALGERQKSNPQFQFLKSTSQNYKYFTKLIEGYTKVLGIKNSDLQNFPLIQINKDNIINTCLQKFQYQQSQQKIVKGKKTQAMQEEDNIDWHDYELVQTIQFQDDNSQPSKQAMSIQHLSEIMKRKLGQRSAGYQKPLQQIISGPSKSKGIMQSCASCGKYIPASEINAHIKACMLDPKQKQRRLQSQNKKVLAGNEVDIHQNMNILASKKQEIFGSSQMSFQLPVQGSKPSTIWDGQNPNMTRTTASIVMMQNQKRKLTESLKKNQQK